jgi:hypothetical protein
LTDFARHRNQLNTISHLVTQMHPTLTSNEK